MEDHSQRVELLGGWRTEGARPIPLSNNCLWTKSICQYDIIVVMEEHAQRVELLGLKGTRPIPQSKNGLWTIKAYGIL